MVVSLWEANFLAMPFLYQMHVHVAALSHSVQRVYFFIRAISNTLYFGCETGLSSEAFESGRS